MLKLFSALATFSGYILTSLCYMASLYVCISAHMHTCILKPITTKVPYGRFISLGANFPKFHEWAHYSGKFILGCSIVGRYCRNWHGCNYVQMAYKHLSLKPWIAKYFSLYNCSQSNLSGWVQALILQAI